LNSSFPNSSSGVCSQFVDGRLRLILRSVYNLQVFRELGDPQPEQATVKEVMKASEDGKDDLVLVEYWDSKTKDEY